MCNSLYGKDLSLWMNLWFRGSTAIVLWCCSYLYLELLTGSSRYQRLVACILGYFLLPLNLLYSNSVFSELRGFPHSHVSVRVLPVGISVSPWHWHPRDLATTAALCTCCTQLIRHQHIPKLISLKYGTMVPEVPSTIPEILLYFF